MVGTANSKDDYIVHQLPELLENVVTLFMFFKSGPLEYCTMYSSKDDAW